MTMDVPITYLDVLPTEIIVKIMLLLPHKSIKNVHEILSVQTINLMPLLSKILIKRMMYFPRKEGRSVAHAIPEYAVPKQYLNWDDENNKKKCLWFVSDFLFKNGTDLIRGDIVYFQPSF